MRVVWLIIGVLAFLAGVLWTIQGLGIVSGSRMSGDSTWAIVGPIVAVVGLLLVLLGRRRSNG